MQIQKTARRLFCICLALHAATNIAKAQEPTFMNAATHPGRGQLYGRAIASLAEYDLEGRSLEDQGVLFKMAYGIRSELALLLDQLQLFHGGDNYGDDSTARSTLRLKYRFMKQDIGPLNTWRSSILAGLGMPSGDSDLEPGSDYPVFGVVSTAILGRHGMNAEAGWRGYQSDNDRYDLNASHLFRLAPARYSRATRGSWYTVLESLNRIDEGGDHRLDISAGILYEARSWAAEIGLRRTLSSDGPAKREFELAIGARRLF